MSRLMIRNEEELRAALDRAQELMGFTNGGKGTRWRQSPTP